MEPAHRLISDRRRRRPTAVSTTGSTRAALQQSGEEPNDLRHARANGVLHPAEYGILSSRQWSSQEDRSLIVLRALTQERDGRAASHSTAARIWALLQGELSPPLHISAPAVQRVKRPGLVISHNIAVPQEFVRAVEGVRVVAPAWAWLDLALGTSEEEALVLADQVLSTRIRRTGLLSPLASRGELEAAILARGRARGIRSARSALALASDSADSPPETRLRYYCHVAGLPEPAVNPLIGDRDGERFFRPDLAFFGYKVAVQYEGQLFHSDPQRVLKDVRRQEVTETLGWVEVRITKEHMRNGGAAAVRKIRAKLIERGWKPGAVSLPVG